MQVIGVAQGGLFGGDTPDILRQFRDQTQITFPLGYDDTESYFAFRRGSGDRVSPFPLDVVIDRQGNIVYISAEYEPSALIAAIESAL